MGNLFITSSCRMTPYTKQILSKTPIPPGLSESIRTLIRTYSPTFELTIDNLCLILNMNPSSKFTKRLLHCFSKKNQYDLASLLLIHFTFLDKSNSHLFLKALLTELLIGKKDRSTIKKILKRQAIFFPEMLIFSSESDENKVITKQLFIERLFPRINTSNIVQKNCAMCIQFIGISQIREKNTNCYYCDCMKMQKGIDDRELVEEYEKMKGYFNDTVKGRNVNVLSFEEFEDKFRNRINDIVLKYAVRFFKKVSKKNYISFEMFIQFFIGFHLTKTYDDKIEFFFKLMTYPKKSIPLTELEHKLNFDAKVLESEFDINNIQNIDIHTFKEISPWIFAYLDFNFSEIAEQIGIIPYTLFQIKPKETKIKQLLIKQFMHNKSLDEFFEEKFKTEQYFYIISSSFWDSFDSAYSGPIPSNIDISTLLYEPMTYREILKNDLVYKMDFFLFPHSLYKEITKHFPLKLTDKGNSFQLCFEKNILRGNIPNKEIGSFEYDTVKGVIRYQRDEGVIEEIDMFPIRVVLLSINNFVLEVSQESGKYYVMEEEVIKKIKKHLKRKTDKNYMLLRQKNMNGFWVSRNEVIKDFLDKYIYKQISNKSKVFFLNNSFKSFHKLKDISSSTIGSITTDRVYPIFICAPYEDGSFQSDFIISNGGKERLKLLNQQYVQIMEFNKLKQKEKNMLNQKQNNEQHNKLSQNEMNANVVKEKTKNANDDMNKKAQNVQKDVKEDKKPQKDHHEEQKLLTPYGLHNLGNTCYFNSILQLFLNIPPLQLLFNDPKLKYFINKKSKFGHKGKFLKKFISLFSQTRTTLRNTLNEIHTHIGQINSNFDNFEQQDASEFLITLIEIFHEELNLKNDRMYIENPSLSSLPAEICSSIYWANSLRRSVSFINALCMYQIKSNLTCRTCSQSKVTYEQNYIMDLPISEGPIVSINITLHRLPLCYKIYLDKVNMNFRKFNYKNKDNSIVHNLKLYALTLDASSQSVNSYKNYFTMSAPVNFSFDIERNKHLNDLFSKIRRHTDLELEPTEEEIILNDNSGSAMKINGYTSFVIVSDSGDVLDVESEITTYVGNNNSVKFSVYEVLNSNGMQMVKDCYLSKITNGEISDDYLDNHKILNETMLFARIKEDNENDSLLKQSQVLTSVFPSKRAVFTIDESSNESDMNESTIQLKRLMKQSKRKEEENIRKTIPISTCNSLPFNIVHYSLFDKKNAGTYIKNSISNIVNTHNNKITHTLLSFNNYNSYSVKEREYPKQITKPVIDNSHSNAYGAEMIIPIMNCVDYEKYCFFQKFSINSIPNYPKQCIIVNNTSHFLTVLELYEFIWELNYPYLINKDKKCQLWFRSNNNQMGCSPFTLRLIDRVNLYDTSHQRAQSPLIKTKCGQCPWYRFCPGCVLNPYTQTHISFKASHALLVDWCNIFKQNELSEEMFYIKYKLQPLINNSTDNANANYIDKSLQDCFSLFLEKEELEDQLYCSECKSHQFFTKNYELDKLPHVLIISLKRFKYNNFFRSKLNQFISYPLEALELKGEVYRLCGVVNHYGSFSAGHYTAIIRKGDKWFYLDDARVYEIAEEKVVHANAYILVYVKEAEVMMSDYYRLLNCIRQRIVERDGKGEYVEGDELVRGEPVIIGEDKGYVMEDWNGFGDVKVQVQQGERRANREEVVKETMFLWNNWK